jgi:hypothetical protein
MGQTDELVKLSDGSLWEVGPSYHYLYAYYPTAVICPLKNGLHVEEQTIPVAQVREWRRQFESSNYGDERARAQRRSTP